MKTFLILIYLNFFTSTPQEIRVEIEVPSMNQCIIWVNKNSALPPAGENHRVLVGSYCEVRK